MTLRVFLCHASQDKKAVRQLYGRLRESGYSPWLDEEDLLPGQDWAHEIRRAVRAADVVAVCLSQQSTQKSGFVQKEIGFALDVAEEQPEGTIFLIPARLEECVVPDRLARWHWVDLFADGGYERLIRSLEHRRAGKKVAETQSTSSVGWQISDELELGTRHKGLVVKEEEYERDELFRDAAMLCIQYQGGSTSLLQRRLRIGYGRAARIIDQLHLAGVLGPPDGSKPRDVLVDIIGLDQLAPELPKNYADQQSRGATMSRKVFISYNFTNRKFAGSVKSFFQKHGGPCEGNPVYVTRDVSAEGDAAIDMEIRTVMEPCKAAIFIIGNDDHNSPWIEREAELAVSKGLGIVAARIKNTTGGLPKKLREIDVSFIDWDPDPLCAALNHAARTADSR